VFLGAAIGKVGSSSARSVSVSDFVLVIRVRFDATRVSELLAHDPDTMSGCDISHSFAREVLREKCLKSASMLHDVI